MDNKIEEDLHRENIKLASIWARIGAYLIDLLLLALLISIMFSSAQEQKIIAAQMMIVDVYSSEYKQMKLDDNTNNIEVLQDLREKAKEAFDIMLFYILLYSGLQIIYNFIFFYFYGATLGQIILRIRVVDREMFDKPTLHVCMKRAILKYILGTTLYISFIFAFADKFYRTLHDRMSKTIVIAH